LESVSHCNATGYALNFGLPYCMRFSDNAPLYTPLGKSWLYCTRSCLANFVRNDIIANITDCATIKKDAFSSHVPCYINCGFCR
ncbi:hypothetical protein PFISCL1PPCAC_13080, partial [Pristionchus fissidentatus]